MKHKKVGARLLSALMTLTLVLGLLPMTALAANTETYAAKDGSWTVTVTDDNELPSADEATVVSDSEKTGSETYNNVKNLLGNLYSGDLDTALEYGIWSLQVEKEEENVEFSSNVTYQLSSMLQGNTSQYQLYQYKDGKLISLPFTVDEDADFTIPDGDGGYIMFVFNCTPQDLNNIVIVETSGLSNKYVKEYKDSGTTLTVVDKELLPDATLSSDSEKDGSPLYKAVKERLTEIYNGDIEGALENGIWHYDVTDGDDKAVEFSDDATYQLYTMVFGDVSKYSFYYYINDQLAKLNFTIDEDNSMESDGVYMFASVTVELPGIEGNMVVVDESDLTKKGGSTLPDNLVPGKTYSITANMYVEGKDNVVLEGTTAYMTNPNLPPLEPMSMNAKLTIGEDGTATLTINELNSIFSLQQIDDGSNVEIVERKWEAVTTDLYGDYKGRIAGLVMKLKDFSGHYNFTNCKEYPTILQEDKFMPIQMDVDFSSAELGFDDTNVSSKSFMDEEKGYTVTVRSSEEDITSKLDDATLVFQQLNGGDEGYKQARVAIEKEYGKEPTFVVYRYALQDSDGTEISLHDNSQAMISVKQVYENGKVYKISDDKAKAVSSVVTSGQQSFTVASLGLLVIVDENDSGEWIHKDYENNDISYSYWWQKTNDDMTLAGVSPVEPKIETDSNGDTRYKIGIWYNLGNDAYEWWSDTDTKLTMKLPMDKVNGKKIYLVMESTDGNFVDEVDKQTMKIEDGYANFDLIGQKQYDSTQGSFMLKALYSAWSGKPVSAWTESNAFSAKAYVLVTDKNLAGQAFYAREDNGILPILKYQGRIVQGLYVGDNCNIDGVTKSYDTGDFTVTLTPKEGYTWLDGTKDTKSYSWSLGKQSLSVHCENTWIKAGQTEVPTVSIIADKGYLMDSETLENIADVVLPTVCVEIDDQKIPLEDVITQGLLTEGKYRLTIKRESGNARNYIFYDFRNTETYLTVLPADAQIIEKPIAATGLVANGSTLTGVPEGEDYTVENGTGSTAGSYTATVTLKEGYYWSDGTQDVLSIPWTIAEKQNGDGNSGSADKVYKNATVNLYVAGSDNKVLGFNAYLTNGNNPLGEGGYDKTAPTVPVSNNVDITVKDGKAYLTLEVPNPVFTLQDIGTESKDGRARIVDTIRDSKTYTNAAGDTRKGRITALKIELDDISGTHEYVFNGCEEFPTLLTTAWDVPLRLHVKFDGGNSGLDSNKNVDTSGIGGGGGNKETTADITVKVSGDTADVSKINTKDVSDKNDLVLNVTDGAKDVTGAKLPVSDLKTIADAKVPNTTVKLSDASASLDLNALKAAKGSTLDIRVLAGSAAEKKLSDAQKAALGDAKNGAAVYVELSSNGKAITDLATGKLTVTAPYKWDGKGSVQAWQMDENGKLTSVPVSCKDNVATLTLTAPGAILLGTTDAQVDTPAETKTFADVPANAYYKKAVDWAVANGITSGTSETTFAPDATCTRAQTVTFLWRAAGSPEPTKQDNPFTDVKADAYYYKAVLWAVENGITSGVTATTFVPDATVSRAQVVSFQYRLAGAPKAEGTNVFTDVPANAYYRDAVLWAAQNGITSGTTATTFAPNAGCTRSQIVTFLYRQLAK